MSKKNLEFCRSLPKLELHAHLNGSLSKTTLAKLKDLKESHVGSSQWPDLQTCLNDLSSCFDLFRIAHDLTQSCEAIKIATLNTIEEFADDGVIYLELRSTLRAVSNMSKRDYLQSMIDSVIEAESKFPTITVCLIVSINRSESIESAQENTHIACEFAKKYPEIVVGLDFSGDPSKGNFLGFKDILLGAKSHLKLALHFAEIENDNEVTEILKCKADRLGHGTFLSQSNFQLLKNADNIVEVCITSNLKCGTVKSMQSHHLRKFLLEKIPVILSTDDKGVFDTTLSREYHLALEHFDLSLEDCWKLNFSAVNFIFASERIKKNLRKKLIEWKGTHF